MLGLARPDGVLVGLKMHNGRPLVPGWSPLYLDWSPAGCWLATRCENVLGAEDVDEMEGVAGTLGARGEYI